jgi:hypothetical protein
MEVVAVPLVDFVEGDDGFRHDVVPEYVAVKSIEVNAFCSY